MFPSWKNALIIFPRSQLNIGQKIVRHNIYSITQIAIIISPMFAKDEEKGQKMGWEQTWDERFRLVSRALGGTAGGTRILSKSGGWRGVCKWEYRAQ